MTKEIEDYCLLSLPHNLKYAIKHGYDYKLYQKQKNEFCFHPSWLKVEVFNNIEWKQYDYIWVLDADCVINEQTIKLEEIIKKEEKPLIISINGENGGRYLNLGSFIVDSKVVPTILKKYEDYKCSKNKFLQEKYWEQEMFNDWYDIEPILFSARPMDEINSWKYSSTSKTKNMQIIRSLIDACTSKDKPNLTMEYVYSYINKNLDKIKCPITSEFFNILHYTYATAPTTLEKKFNEICTKKQFVHHLMDTTKDVRIQNIKQIIT
jgi:hypothetical protein